MKRTKAYRRFMMKKCKKHARTLVSKIWNAPELIDDQTLIGKLANHGKQLCSCPMCGNCRRHNKGRSKYTLNELRSLDDLKNFELYI